MVSTTILLEASEYLAEVLRMGDYIRFHIGDETMYEIFKDNAEFSASFVTMDKMVKAALDKNNNHTAYSEKEDAELIAIASCSVVHDFIYPLYSAAKEAKFNTDRYDSIASTISMLTGKKHGEA